MIRRKQTSIIKVLPAKIKSVNPVQKYSHIMELFDCILNMFIFMFLCSINFSISLGTCSTLKPCVPVSTYLSRFIIYAPSYILGKLFLEKTPLTLGSF